MLTPARKSPDERGQRWLQAEVQQLLADSGIQRPSATKKSLCSRKRLLTNLVR